MYLKNSHKFDTINSMNKLLTLLLLSPLVFAEDKTISLSCQPTTTLICIDECKTFTQEDIVASDLEATATANISVKQSKTKTEGVTFYYLDRGLGFESAEKMANNLKVTLDGDLYGEPYKHFNGSNIIYTFNLLTKEYIYSTVEKKSPYKKTYSQKYNCSEATSIFD